MEETCFKGCGGRLDTDIQVPKSPDMSCRDLETDAPGILVLNALTTASCCGCLK